MLILRSTASRRKGEGDDPGEIALFKIGPEIEKDVLEINLAVRGILTSVAGVGGVGFVGRPRAEVAFAGADFPTAMKLLPGR